MTAILFYPHQDHKTCPDPLPPDAIFPWLGDTTPKKPATSEEIFHKLECFAVMQKARSHVEQPK